MGCSKDYLTYENERNRRGHRLFTDMLKEAFGADSTTLIAHHVCFGESADKINEIPSADTLIFDHAVMSKLFGDNTVYVLKELAAIPAEERDAVLGEFYYRQRGRK